MDNNELLNKTYQENFVKAIGIAEKYEGAETQYKDLMENLIAVESAVNHVIDDEKPADPKTEREVLAMVIDDVLSTAIKSFYDQIEQSLSESKIFQKKLAGVLLPPGDTPVILGDGSKEFEEPRFHGRLKELIGFLHDNGIYTDDIVVCFGEGYENMMRQLSYALIEIPRLNKQILVCDQIGEATFVVDGIFSRETLLSLSKEKLQQQYPDKVRRIIYNNIKQWMEELLAAVFYEWAKEGEESSASPQKIEPRPKIDVKKREEIMEKIKEKYTGQQFIELTSKQRGGENFAGTGLGIIAIARLFNVEGSPIGSNSVFLQLAQKIYGEGVA